MKASELICHLQKAIDMGKDFEVVFFDADLFMNGDDSYYIYSSVLGLQIKEWDESLDITMDKAYKCRFLNYIKLTSFENVDGYKPRKVIKEDVADKGK